MDWISTEDQWPNHNDRVWIDLNGKVVQADFYKETVGGIPEHTFCLLDGTAIWDNVERWATLEVIFQSKNN